nr:MAG TPA: hypothetical protein [Caudoviricetes sp.]
MYKIKNNIREVFFIRYSLMSTIHVYYSISG